MENYWFYLSGANELGPFSEGHLRTLLAGGEISPDTMLRKRSCKEWCPASECLSGDPTSRQTEISASPTPAAESTMPPTETPAGAGVANKMSPELQNRRADSDLACIAAFHANKMSAELKKRRALQTALAGGALGCLALAAFVVVGIVIDATMGPPYPKVLDALAQGVLLISFVGIIRAVYMIFTTPWSLTKQALRDREFWRL